MKTRVRAIIIKDGEVLLIKRTKKDFVYWVVPGGGVDGNETKEEALMRECEEELGVQIKINSLEMEMASGKPETLGQKEFFYLCDIVDGALGSGQGPEFQKDSSYVGSYDPEWISIKKLLELDLRPEEIKKLIYKKYR